MGCDIHSYLEKYTSINGENKWVNVDYWQINPHFGLDDSKNEYDQVSFYIGRNYELFGILAGVRSSEDPIKEPRGLPEDVSDVTKREYEKWDEVHTPSYYTMKELKDYIYNNSDNKELIETLSFFVNPMNERFKNEFWIDDDNRHTIKENGFRVVFWFDN